MSKPTDTVEQWPAGADLDRAMESAFYEAVRRHRAANQPMVMWENGESVTVSPFEIPLPGEELPRASRSPVLQLDTELPRRRVGGAD